MLESVPDKRINASEIIKFLENAYVNVKEDATLIVSSKKSEKEKTVINVRKESIQKIYLSEELRK
jgi:hypothetical protein